MVGLDREVCFLFSSFLNCKAFIWLNSFTFNVKQFSDFSCLLQYSVSRLNKWYQSH